MAALVEVVVGESAALRRDRHSSDYCCILTEQVRSDDHRALPQLSTSTTLEASSSSSRSAPEEKSASGVAVAAATTSVSNSSGSSFARRSSSGGRAPALLARSAREPEPASAATGPSGSRRHRACGSRLGRNRAVRSGRRHSSATSANGDSRRAGSRRRTRAEGLCWLDKRTGERRIKQ
jgi:hypothetical protein